MRYFYVDANNQSVGPYPLDVMQALRVAGTVKEDTLVCEEGGSEWKPCGQVMVAPSPPTPPAIPTPAPPTEGTSAPAASKKSYLATWLLCLFLGYFGIHRFYVGKIKLGLLQLFTLGACGVWVLVDLILILANAMRDGEGRQVKGVGAVRPISIVVTILMMLAAAGSGHDKERKNSPPEQSATRDTSVLGNISKQVTIEGSTATIKADFDNPIRLTGIDKDYAPIVSDNVGSQARGLARWVYNTAKDNSSVTRITVVVRIRQGEWVKEDQYGNKTTVPERWFDAGSFVIEDTSEIRRYVKADNYISAVGATYESRHRNMHEDYLRWDHARQ